MLSKEKHHKNDTNKASYDSNMSLIKSFSKHTDDQNHLLQSPKIKTNCDVVEKIIRNLDVFSKKGLQIERSCFC